MPTLRYKTIVIDGISIFYREAGDPDRPTLLLLHGFPSSSHMYRDLLGDLGDRYHIIAPDYPGFGNSDMPALERFAYTFDNLSVQLPQVRAGKIKALAVTGARRLAALADVPTLAESGLAGYDCLAWMGISAPAKTPKEIIARLSQEIAKILATSEAREWLAAQGAEPGGESPAEFAAYIRAEHAKWGPIIRKVGFKAD